MNNSILLDNIRKLCKKNKITITKLETDLFLSPGLISRWNKNIPSLDRIMDIAQYFNVSIDELVGRSNNAPEGADISRFILLLYNKSLIADIDWEILDFQHPPKELCSITPFRFFSCESCDCYYSCYKGGFSFLAAAHTADGNLQLALYVLPDIYSQLQCVCLDTASLTQLYEYLTRRFSQKLNAIKTANYISSFINDTDDPNTDADDLSLPEKVTPLRNITEASNF